MKIEYAWKTHVGLLRPRNEDSWGVRPQSPSPIEGSHWLFAVADGMGGHPGGEVASSLAIQAVLDSHDAGFGSNVEGAGTGGGPAVAKAADLKASGRPPASERPPETLARLFLEAGARIREEGARSPRHREMGTTLTVLSLGESQAWVGHIGDTRLYWIRGGDVVQITRDHTMAQDLIEAGLLEARASEQHPSSHVLTRCLGVCPNHEPDLLLSPLRLRPGDRLLLASDGLVKVVPLELLSKLASGGPPQETCERLVKAALDGGAPDNVTLVLISILETPQNGVPGSEFSIQPSLDWHRGVS